MKYAVSACLLGENCKYSGGNNYNEELCRYLEGHEVIRLCPEVMGGLPTPRTPFELIGGVAVSRDGENLHAAVTDGTEKCLEILKNEKIDCVILQPRSPSCGVGKIYDGSFSGRLTDGNGILVQALIRAGYKVMTSDGFLFELRKRKYKETFYTCERAEWRRWLSENFETKKEVWFVFPSKDSGEPALSYNDAVEEALCFGWIDSTTGHLDPLHGVRRFTPRKDFGYYSRPNIERLIWLDRQGMIHPNVRPTVVGVIEAEYVFPADIIAALREDETVWKNYEGFSEPYKRIRVAYIDAARNRPQEFDKRLRSFISKTRSGKLITGFGGIEKYYGMMSE